MSTCGCVLSGVRCDRQRHRGTVPKFVRPATKCSPLSFFSNVVFFLSDTAGRATARPSPRGRALGALEVYESTRAVHACVVSRGRGRVVRPAPAPRARAIKNEVLVPKTLTRVTHSHSLTHIIASAMTEARSSLNKTHATQNTHGTQKTYASGSGKACATHAPTARRTGRAMPGLSGAKERRRPPACRAANSAARRHVTVTPRGMLTRRRARSPCCLPPSSWASLVAFGFGVGGGVRVGSEPGPGLRARAKGVG